MVTKSALELMSYKLHTLVICVSSNFLCTVLCKILRYQLSSYVILHFNKHNYIVGCYSTCKDGKLWIQCISCKRWGHEEWAGTGELQIAYSCNLCVVNYLPLYVIVVYISINTISYIFVLSLFDTLCPEAVPVCPGTRGKLMIFFEK